MFDFMDSPAVTSTLVMVELFAISLGIVLAFNAIVHNRVEGTDRVGQFLLGVAATAIGLVSLIWPDWAEFLNAYPPMPTGGIH